MIKPRLRSRALNSKAPEAPDLGSTPVSFERSLDDLLPAPRGRFMLSIHCGVAESSTPNVANPNSPGTRFDLRAVY
jgi:hypothetical protein